MQNSLTDSWPPLASLVEMGHSQRRRAVRHRPPGPHLWENPQHRAEPWSSVCPFRHTPCLTCRQFLSEVESRWRRRKGGRRSLSGSPLLRLCKNISQCNVSSLKRKSLNLFKFLRDGCSHAGGTVVSTVTAQEEGLEFSSTVVLCGVCMFFLFLRGFFPCTPASCHSPTTCS